MIENGSRSEGIPGVFQATRVVLYAKAALTGVMGSAPFGYISKEVCRIFVYVNAVLVWNFAKFIKYIYKPQKL